MSNFHTAENNILLTGFSVGLHGIQQMCMMVGRGLAWWECCSQGEALVLVLVLWLCCQAPTHLPSFKSSTVSVEVILFLHKAAKAARSESCSENYY